MPIRNNFFLIKLLLFCVIFSAEFYGQALPDSSLERLAHLTPQKQIKYLGTVCWNLREKDTDLGIVYGKKALKLADSIKAYDDVAEICNFIGVEYLHYKYDSKDALPYFHKALETGLMVKDSTEIGYAYNNLGDAFYLTGNAPLALEYSKTSLDIFDSLNDSLGIAYGYINLGLVYGFQKKYDLALEYINKAIAIREKLRDKIGIASAQLEVAKIYNAKEDYSTALKYYEESLKLHKEIDNKRYMAHCLNGIGNIYYSQGKYKEALERYNEALKLNIERDDEFAIIGDRIGIALVYSKTNKVGPGKQELDTAVILAKKLLIPTKLLDVYKAYSDFYLNINDYKSASERLQQVLFIYDSLYSRQQYETLSEVENKFLISHRLNEMHRDLQVKTAQEFYLILTIILMGVVGGLLYWRYKSRKVLTEKLSSLNASKDKLFSIIGHDLKNPVGSVRNFLEILHSDYDDMSEKERKEFIEYAYDGSKSITKLLHDLLEWGRLTKGIVDIKIEKADLDTIVKEVVELLDSSAMQKGIKLEYTDCKCTIAVDKNMLHTVLRNFVHNAIKFTNENGKIIISHSEDNDFNYISTKDNGIGIAQENIDDLFNIGKKTSSYGTANETGTGLGLPICKEFVEKCGGEIVVNSKPGEGSEFIVKLPKEIRSV